MSLKKLFTDTVQIDRFPKRKIKITGSSVIESFDLLKQKADFRKKIFGFVNISASLGDYVCYGSAEEYYEKGIERVYNEYPYDGSDAEKLQFHNNSNTFDYYIWKELYPKTTGYVTLNEGTLLDQRIGIKAGPNLNTAYKASAKQTNNLAFDSEQGVTVEFWAKPSPEDGSAALFELRDSTNGHLAIYPTYSTNDIEWSVESQQGLVLEASIAFTPLSDYAENWHHYAFVLTSLGSGSGLTASLYVDGAFTEQKRDTSNLLTDPISTVSGNLGQYIDPGNPSNVDYYTGSIDEFRYWKTARNAKEIGLNWNSHVHGGSNTTGSLNASYPLSLYLKFNEGITGDDSTDSEILDYSGRIASASFLSYESTGRSTGSAIEDYTVSSGLGYVEEKDPIIRSNNPNIDNLKTEKTRIGKVYDNNNTFNFYALMPEWIRSDDDGDLKRISHIVGAYMDELFSQIKTHNRVYRKDYKDYYKSFPYYENLLDSHGFKSSPLFGENTLEENLLNRNSNRYFASGSVDELKSTILRNIYNNLLYLYKTKGTESSIRNLLHCYGVDEALIRLRAYSNNTVGDIENQEKAVQFQDKVVDFYGMKNAVASEDIPSGASVFNFTSSDSSVDDRAYVPSFEVGTFTLEANTYFPKFKIFGNDFYVQYQLSSSVFGIHAASSSAPTDTAWASPDSTGMAVYTVRDGATSKQARFSLASTNGVFTEVGSELFEVYDSTNWNLAIVFEPQRDLSNLPSYGTQPFWIKLYGYENESGRTVNSFAISSSISITNAALITAEAKRAFVGAEKTGYTGSLIYRSDCRVGNLRFYTDALTSEEVELHAKFKNTQGRKRPYENYYRSHDNDSVYVPKFLSLLFEWDFEQITSANSLGTFEVSDRVSGSTLSGFGEIGAAVSSSYVGLGYGFATDFKVYETEYVSKAKALLPEESFAANKINVNTESDTAFGINMAPAKEAVLVGKSMYDVISQDILNIFAGVVDFNELIGNPVNKYREDYKGLEKLRDLYFSRVFNDPDLEKFVNYFKWLDAAIYTIIDNVIPATTDFAGQQTNIVESHALERNKFPYKFPTLEFRADDPTATVSSSVSLANVLPTTGAALTFDQRAGSLQGSYDFSSGTAGNYTKPYQLISTVIPESAMTGAVIANVLPTTGAALTFDQRAGSLQGSYNFASGTAGNYTKNYQIFNTVGRTQNNLYVKSEDGLLTSVSSYVTGVIDYYFPDRNKTKSIIVQRFNSPGGVETSRGMLDAAAREFSVYNSLNWRNYTVRSVLNKLQRYSQAQFGYQSGSTTTASYHAVNRNPLKRPALPYTTADYSSLGLKYTVGGVASMVQGTASSEIEALEAYSISAWFHITASGGANYQNILNLGDGGDGIDLYITDNSAEPHISLIQYWTPYNGVWNTPANSIKVGKWHHVGISYDGSAASNVPSIFIDGIQQTLGITSPTGTIQKPTSYCTIGDSPHRGWQILGYLDEVAVWDKALSDPELHQLYYPPSPALLGPANLFNHPASSSLVAWWRMGESLGGGPPNYVILDETANDINCTMNGFVHLYGTASMTGGVGYTASGDPSLNTYVAAYPNTETNFDNWFIQHAIPRSSLQYSWITASYLSQAEYGYSTGSDITFISASEFGSFQNNNTRHYFGIDKHLLSAVPSTQSAFIPTDFIGLNTNIVETITASTNQLGFPSLLLEDPLSLPVAPPVFNVFNYINNSVAAADGGVVSGRNDPNRRFPGAASILNGILLNRNGPYGYPSWKQIRTGEHPVARYHKERNIISFLRKTPINPSGFVLANDITNVIEPPVQFNRPLFLKVAGSSLLLKSSYNNIKSGFANKTLQANKSNFEKSMKQNTTLFDKVLQEEDASFSKVSYRDIIFPPPERVCLSGTMTRTTFDNSWWRDVRQNRDAGLFGTNDRLQLNQVNSMGWSLYSAHQDNNINSSRWSLDPRIDFSTSDSMLGIALPVDDLDGAGELQNQYTPFHFLNGYAGSTVQVYLAYAPTYAHRTTEFIMETGSNFPGKVSFSVTGGYMNVGSALWQVGDQAGKNPFYNSYADYNADLKLMGKEYSIIPEFKISDHIETYLSTGLNFKQALTSQNVFSLTGTIANEPIKSISSVELRDLVDVVKNETNLPTKKFGLKVSALLKLLPYEGFYPQQRTIQLAAELSSSYQNSIRFVGNTGSFRTFLQPFVMPGILFNTIKSGIAVDYPIQTDITKSYGRYGARYTLTWNAGAGAQTLKHYGDFVSKKILDITGNFYSAYETELNAKIANETSSGSYGFLDNYIGLLFPGQDNSQDTSTGELFSERLPWETILDPFTAQARWCDDEPQNIGYIDSTISFTNAPKVNYTLMANNFFSEVVNFFIADSKLTSFESEAKVKYLFDPDKRYDMDVYLKNSNINNFSQFSRILQSEDPTLNSATNGPLDFFVSSSIAPSASANTVMYDRPSAFGPNRLDLTSRDGFPGYSSYFEQIYYITHSPYTPPYYDGLSRMRLSFKPSSTQHTLDDVVGGITASFVRATNNVLSVLRNDIKWNSEGLINITSSYGDQSSGSMFEEMQLSASLIYDAIIPKKAIKYDNLGHPREFDSNLALDLKSWVIHPKFECPVLNFKDVSVERPAAGSSMAAKGMWHQYGAMPDYNSTGIFLEIADVPDAEKWNPAITASLADVVGFEKTKKSVGTIAPAGKEIKEALVVVPYYLDGDATDSVQFFELSTALVEKLKLKANEPSVTDDEDQLVRQIRLMKDYVFPPFLDFVSFDVKKAGNKDIKTPIMYIFQFGRTLSQQDLADIWQGVMPTPSTDIQKKESIIDLETEVGQDVTLDTVIENNIQTLLLNFDKTIKTQQVTIPTGFREPFVGEPQYGQVIDVPTKFFKSGQKLLDDIDFSQLRFFVFKVKQRGEFEYKNITQDTRDDGFNYDFTKTGFATQIPSFTKDNKFKLSYSYNWPYDFFSLIELAKVEAKITLGED